MAKKSNKPRRFTISLRLSPQELTSALKWAEELEISFLGTPVSTGIRSLVLEFLKGRPAEESQLSTMACLDWLERHHYYVGNSDKNRRAMHSQIAFAQPLPPDEPLDAPPALSDIEQEAEEVGRQLEEAMRRLEQEDNS